MCQEENVVAIAKIPKGGLNGEFWYLDENKKIHKPAPIIFTHHNPNNLDRFTGELILTDSIKQALNGAKIQTFNNIPPVPENLSPIISIKYTGGSSRSFIYNKSYSDRHTYQDVINTANASQITFGPFTDEVTIKFIKP